MIDMQRLRSEAIRLHPIDASAAQLLQQAGDEIQRLQTQRDALMQSLAPRATAEAPHG